MRLKIVILIIWLFPTLLLADSLTVSGLTFHVDELIEIDPEHTQVTVFGKTRIVSNSKVEDFVTGHYLNDLSHLDRFSSDAILNFSLESWKAGKIERAALGLNAAFLHPSFDTTDFEGFLEELSTNGDFYNLFQRVFSEDTATQIPQVIQYRMIYEISTAEPDWVLRTPLGLKILQQADYFGFLRKLFMEAVVAHDQSMMEELVASLSSLLPKEDERLTEFKLALDRYLLLSEMDEGEMLEVWYPVGEREGTRELVSRVSATVAVSRLHNTAESVLDEGNAQRALQLLSRIDFSLRTPTTHELVFRALQRLPLSTESVVLEPSVATLLSFISSKDERVRLRYTDFLERQIRWLLDRGMVLRSEYYFNQLLALRPDPNRFNDYLRIKEAVTWAALDRRDNAEIILSNLSTSPGLGHRFQLFRYGYYIDLNLLVLLIGIPIILISSVYLYWKSRPSYQAVYNDELEDVEFEELAEGEKQAAFSLLKVNRALNPRMQEYRKLLALFGMGPDPSFKDIKAAYRSRIKKVHPDLQFDNVDSKGSESFIEIKRDYERIIELRKMLGFGKE